MRQASIAEELKTRLLEHAPHLVLPANRLELLDANISEQYKNAQFDCIIAPLMLVEQNDRALFFKEIHRILAPNGIFLLSTLGDENAYALEALGDSLLQMGFQLPVVDRELLTLQYGNMSELLEDLERSGLNEKHVHITTASSQDILATLEVMYGYARGAVVPTNFSGKIEIPIENIKIRKPL